MVFVEDLNLVGLSRAMLGKHCLDAGFGQFFNILEQTCFTRGVFFQKVDAKKTSPICPNCLNQTGKKELSERVHSCHSGYTTDRDVAAAQVVLQRGIAAVGHTACDACLQVNSLESLLRQESPRLQARECQIHGALWSMIRINCDDCCCTEFWLLPSEVFPSKCRNKNSFAAK